MSQFLLFLLVEFLLGVWKPLAAPPPAAYVSAHAEPKEELDEIYAHASAEERRQMQDEKAQAKLRVHLTPRQSHGRVSNSLGMDGWANASLDELRQMDDENALFHKAFYQKDSEWTWKTRPEAREGIRQLRALWLNYDFKQLSKARPEVRAHIRRIRARNSQREEWVRHHQESARTRRYVMLKEAAREVYKARGRALAAVIMCRYEHIHQISATAAGKQYSTHDLVEALAVQAAATHAFDEALARLNAKIQLVKTLRRG